jgi:hypothetical protein
MLVTMGRRRSVVGTKAPRRGPERIGIRGAARAGDRIRTGDVQLGKLAFYP